MIYVTSSVDDKLILPRMLYTASSLLISTAYSLPRIWSFYNININIKGEEESSSVLVGFGKHPARVWSEAIRVSGRLEL
jgi:hypothetical protein